MRLIHSGVTVSSEANADAFYGNLFGLTYSRVYTVPDELMNDLFGQNGDHNVRLYDLGDHKLEVFMTGDTNDEGEKRESGDLETLVNDAPPSANHLCIGVDDRESLIEKALSQGFMVYKKVRKGKPDLVFIYDHDGNPYEIIAE